MRKNILILIIATVLLFTACNTVNAPADSNKLAVKRDQFNNINRDGSFVLTADEKGNYKVQKDFSDNKDLSIRQFEWYTDPLCPDCLRAHLASEEYVEKAIKDGLMEIRYHNMNFLSHAIENDYSLAMSAWILGVAERQPEKVVEVMDMIYNAEFREKMIPETNIQLRVLEYIKEHKVLDNKVADDIYRELESFENAANRGSVNIRRFKKWKDLSPKEDGTFFAPFIYNINGGKAFEGEKEDADKYIVKPLQGYVECDTGCD